MERINVLRDSLFKIHNLTLPTHWIKMRYEKDGVKVSLLFTHTGNIRTYFSGSLKSHGFWYSFYDFLQAVHDYSQTKTFLTASP